ncbi:MAG: hypothetical protein C4550_02580 [Nitrospiraceae bacterium]|nr:MAG: hypothetical protein C4550_02580 [Nitrospiraceae bacterium]
MPDNDKVVLRFTNGKLLKGYLQEFSQESPEISFKKLDGKKTQTIPVLKLKAIFFVKTFEGNSKHKEKKIYGIRRSEGKKIFVKFKDDESMVGYLQGKAPWDKGFFLSKPDERQTGLFIVPVDEDSNNIKIFVIYSAVKDITAVP